MAETAEEILSRFGGNTREYATALAILTGAPKTGRDIVAVTPDDAENDPAGPFIGLMVRDITTGSTLSIATPLSGETARVLDEIDLRTFTNGQDYGFIPLECLRVNDTGTADLGEVKGVK